MLGSLEADPVSPMGNAGGFPGEHLCPVPGICCPGPTEGFGLHLMAQQSLGKCLNVCWISMAFGSTRVSPLRDGVLSSHRFCLNISLICPPPQKPPADPLLLCLPQLWSSELSPYTKRTGNWLGFVASWQQNCLLLCSSGGKKPLPPFSLLQQSVSFLFVKNQEETLLFKMREPNSIPLSF